MYLLKEGGLFLKPHPSTAWLSLWRVLRNLLYSHSWHWSHLTQQHLVDSNEENCVFVWGWQSIVPGKRLSTLEIFMLTRLFFLAKNNSLLTVVEKIIAQTSCIIPLKCVVVWSSPKHSVLRSWLPAVFDLHRTIWGRILKRAFPVRPPRNGAVWLCH